MLHEMVNSHYLLRSLWNLEIINMAASQRPLEDKMKTVTAGYGLCRILRFMQ